MLTREERLPTLICWQCFSWRSPGWFWLSLLQEHIICEDPQVLFCKELCIYLCWISWDSCFSCLLRSLRTGSTTTTSNNQSSKLFAICKSAEAALCPTIQAINVNVKQYWSQCQWWYKALLKADTVLLTTTLEDWYLSQVSGHLIVPLSNLYFIIFSARLLEKAGLKTLLTSRSSTLLLALQASHGIIEGY